MQRGPAVPLVPESGTSTGQRLLQARSRLPLCPKPLPAAGCDGPRDDASPCVLPLSPAALPRFPGSFEQPAAGPGSGCAGGGLYKQAQGHRHSLPLPDTPRRNRESISTKTTVILQGYKILQQVKELLAKDLWSLILCYPHYFFPLRFCIFCWQTIHVRFQASPFGSHI